MRLKYFFVCTAAIAFLFTSCGGDRSSQQTGGEAARANIGGGQASVEDDLSARNIVQIAAASDDHTTLVAAVMAAGMQDVLANPGPLTVFAPNNAAFEKLPEGTVENLLKPENKSTLMRIITHHATPGTYKADELEDGLVLGQATGINITVEVKGDEVFVGGAKVLGSVEASNGVVHVVDAVLLPPQ